MSTEAERVAAGAAYLNEREPGWLQRIDLDRLDLKAPCRCVLGQLAMDLPAMDLPGASGDQWTAICDQFGPAAIEALRQEVRELRAVLLPADPFDAPVIAPECRRGDCAGCRDDVKDGHPCDHGCHDPASPWDHVRSLREQLALALARIGALERQAPQARQAEYEADLAAADLAESGYDRHGSSCNRRSAPWKPQGGWHERPDPRL